MEHKTNHFIPEAPNDPSVRYEPKQDISCATQKGKIGYRYSSGSDNMASAKYPQYIVICWKQQTSHDITVRQVNDKVVRGGSLDEYTTLTTVLFHEFMHATVPASKSLIPSYFFSSRLVLFVIKFAWILI